MPPISLTFYYSRTERKFEISIKKATLLTPTLSGLRISNDAMILKFFPTVWELNILDSENYIFMLFEAILDNTTEDSSATLEHFSLSFADDIEKFDLCLQRIIFEAENGQKYFIIIDSFSDLFECFRDWAKKSIEKLSKSFDIISKKCLGIVVTTNLSDTGKKFHSLPYTPDKNISISSKICTEGFQTSLYWADKSVKFLLSGTNLNVID